MSASQSQDTGHSRRTSPSDPLSLQLGKCCHGGRRRAASPSQGKNCSEMAERTSPLHEGQPSPLLPWEATRQLSEGRSWHKTSCCPMEGTQADGLRQGQGTQCVGTQALLLTGPRRQFLQRKLISQALEETKARRGEGAWRGTPPSPHFHAVLGGACWCLGTELQDSSQEVSSSAMLSAFCGHHLRSPFPRQPACAHSSQRLSRDQFLSPTPCLMWIRGRSTSTKQRDEGTQVGNTRRRPPWP